MPFFSFVMFKFLSQPIVLSANFLKVNRWASCMPLISSILFNSTIRRLSTKTSIRYPPSSRTSMCCNGNVLCVSFYHLARWRLFTASKCTSRVTSISEC